MVWIPWKKHTHYEREAERRRAELEEEERYFRGRFRFRLRKVLPWVLVIIIIVGIIWSVRSPIVRTRVQVALEKSKLPELVFINLRDTVQRAVDKYIYGLGWRAPPTKKIELKGIEIVKFEAGELPYNVGEIVEAEAEVVVYKLDPEDFGSSKISFSCDYEDGGRGRIIIEGIERSEVYARNNEEVEFDVRCVLPEVRFEEEGEVIKKKINFRASYIDLVMTSTLYVGTVRRDIYLEEEKQGTLSDFLRKHSAYPMLIGADRKAIPESDKGPVDLALTTNRLPLTENGEYKFFIGYTPKVSEWAGNINLKSLGLSEVPTIFEIKECNLGVESVWAGENLIGCDNGCQRDCKFSVVGAGEYIDYEVVAEARLDYTTKATTTIDVRRII